MKRGTRCRKRKASAKEDTLASSDALETHQQHPTSPLQGLTQNSSGRLVPCFSKKLRSKAASVPATATKPELQEQAVPAGCETGPSVCEEVKEKVTQDESQVSSVAPTSDTPTEPVSEELAHPTDEHNSEETTSNGESCNDHQSTQHAQVPLPPPTSLLPPPPPLSSDISIPGTSLSQIIVSDIHMEAVSSNASKPMTLSCSQPVTIADRSLSPSPPHGSPSPSPPHGSLSPSPPHGSLSPSPPHGSLSPSPLHGSLSPSPPHGSPSLSPPHGSLSPPPPRFGSTKSLLGTTGQPSNQLSNQPSNQPGNQPSGCTSPAGTPSAHLGTSLPVPGSDVTEAINFSELQHTPAGPASRNPPLSPVRSITTLLAPPENPPPTGWSSEVEVMAEDDMLAFEDSLIGMEDLENFSMDFSSKMTPVRADQGGGNKRLTDAVTDKHSVDIQEGNTHPLSDTQSIEPQGDLEILNDSLVAMVPTLSPSNVIMEVAVPTSDLETVPNQSTPLLPSLQDETSTLRSLVEELSALNQYILNCKHEMDTTLRQRRAWLRSRQTSRNK